MAETNPKVMALVAASIKKSPDASTEELQRAAAKKFPSVGKLSRRQFNARYALQVRRKLPSVKRKAARKAAAKRAAAGEPTPPKQAKRRARGTARRAAAAVAAVGRPKSKAEERTADRDAIRHQFLRFASDITAAEGRNDLVKVLANVDKYVDAVVKAAS